MGVHLHAHCQQMQHADERNSKRRRALDTTAAAGSPQLKAEQQHSDSAPSSPSSAPSSPPNSPQLDSKSASSAAAAGNSCHQCKTAKDASLLLFCTSAAEKGVRKRRCRKKYCDSWSARRHSSLLHACLLLKKLARFSSVLTHLRA